MKSSFIFATLLFAIACDGPTRMREGVSNFSSTQGIPTSGTQNPGNTTGSFVPGTPSTTTGSTTGGANIQAGFENCNTNPTHYHAGIGYMSVCQSSTNELYFRMSFTTTDQSDGTCIVPLYKDSQGNSTYLGNAQCTKHNANQVSHGYVTKSRANYGGYPVNGVMVMKFSGTTSFFQCMQGYDINYASCKSSTCQQYGSNPNLYNQCMNSFIASCDQTAKQYMANRCNDFKSNNAYIDIRTK